MSIPSLASIAIPSVLTLISFLAYSSQYLFSHIDPRPLSGPEFLRFNALLLCLLICYYRACSTNPGVIPANWAEKKEDETTAKGSRVRWCRKCEAPKAPRSHHCKICKRCIPKMDHHCPWTSNCVSHTTFPHFLRFLLYAALAMTYLEYFLYQRGAVLWNNRRMPSYLGPSVVQMIHLLILFCINSITLFALTILFVKSVWSLAVNTTTIEGWEIERHETLLRRARVLGGFLRAPDGSQVRLARQEFPYDIGIWGNLKQGMGTWNVLMWFWPFASTPSIESGISCPSNGFEDPSMSWPPPDPDRMPRNWKAPIVDESFAQESDADRLAKFKERQTQDMNRFELAGGIRRRHPFHERYANAEDPDWQYDMEGDDYPTDDESGEEGWRNGEGERLDDFGVDEGVEFYDEDNIPLAELIRQKKLVASGDVLS
ncbi:zf-DHHC-domain-containing protein [Eremomyces bilateralis CBS 781.70]|uniref:Palmitoyltransferase PFA4 n=1 Tax=Eremomyces bilateralis CBS 781.70 TaxID=1392243 RepID=A0A6G1FSJ6_9PEZI|nr:zf-DHHC-domain-containing protein [Eremomyces bilateralis CBS 781.70]KAF1808659.1 zf-DHHC-domain-containing protein [Eremomyces bilateralis CBS 781.70]